MADTTFWSPVTRLPGCEFFLVRPVIVFYPLISTIMAVLISHAIPTNISFWIVSCSNDTTKTGYDLGPPDRRSLNPERERDLSAPAVCVVRALMHSAFIWAACNNQEELVELSRVTKDQVRPSALPEFFWLHLEKDLTCLSRSTGRGLDECIIIVHLVLQQILGTNPPACECIICSCMI